MRNVPPGASTLIVTFLPNRLSYTECLARLVGRDHHDRLYARAGIIGAFRRHGFEPVHAGYHQVTPSLSGSFARAPGPLARGLVNALYRANGVLERTWGVRRLAANIMIVAESAMSVSSTTTTNDERTTDSARLMYEP